MKDLFDIIFHVILEKPGEFQIRILEEVKRRAIEQLGDQTVSQNAILRAMKNKHLIIQDSRLMFAWRFYRLLEDGAAAFQEMGEADFLRTLRYHWTKMDYKPAVAKGTFEELVGKLQLLTPEQRKIYLRVITDGTLPPDYELNLDIYLGWMAKEAVKEAVLGGTEPEGTLEQRAVQYAEEQYSGLSAALHAELKAMIPKMVESLGLQLAGKEELFREVYESEVDFELWHQRVPQIMRQARTRADMKNGIQELLSDKAVLTEVQHEAKEGKGQSAALANLCMGLRDSKKGNYQAAIAEFARCIQLGLNTPEVLVEKAIAHQRMGEYIAAARILMSFEKEKMESGDKELVLAIVEDLPQDQHRLGWDLVRRYGLENEIKLERLREFGEGFLSEGDHDTAEAILRRILAADSRDFDAYYLIAKSNYRRGDKVAADDWINKMIQLEQRNFYSYYRAALLYMELNVPGEAMAYLGKSLELNPEFTEGMTLLGRLMTQARDGIRTLISVKIEREITRNPAKAIFDSALRWAEDEGAFFRLDINAAGPLAFTDGVPAELLRSVAPYLKLLTEAGGATSRIEKLVRLESYLRDYQLSCDQLAAALDRQSDQILQRQLVLEYLGQRLYPKALTQLQRMIKADGEDGELYYFRALCHLGVGHQDDADADFVNAVNHGFSRANLFVGKMCARQNRASNAAAALHAFRNEAAPTAWELLEAAQTFIEIGDFRAAQSIVEPFIADDADIDRSIAVRGYRIMGESLFRMGPAHRAEAERNLQRYLKGLPKDSTEMVDESLALYSYTGNLQILDRVVKILESESDEEIPAVNYFNLGRTYAAMAEEKRHAANAKKAIESFRKAVMLNPMQFRYHYALAMAYLEREQPVEAQSSLQIALDINPFHFPSALQLGKLSYKSGQLSAAFQALERAAMIFPPDPEPHLFLSKILTRQRDENGAIRECSLTIAGALSRGNADLVKESIHMLARMYLDSANPDAFASNLINAFQQNVRERRGLISDFLHEVSDIPSGEEIDDVRKKIVAATEQVRKLGQHSTLIANIPRDLKKITAISDQLVKRTIAELKKSVGKAQEQLGELASKAEDRQTSEPERTKAVQMPKEDRAALLDAFARIKPAKVRREKLDEMEAQDLTGTFEYVIEFLDAVRWQEKVVEAVEDRILNNQGEAGPRFLKNLLSTIRACQAGQVTGGVWNNLAKLAGHLARLAAASQDLETEWTRKGEIGPSLDAIPVEITEANAALDTLSLQLEIVKE